jgi:hypothetical protein
LQFHLYQKIDFRNLTDSQRGQDRVAHFAGADLPGSRLVDVAGPVALGQDLLDRVLDALGGLLLAKV